MDTASTEISSWVKDYTDEMYQYTISKTNDKVAAEDIVQNTFLAAFESHSRFKQKSSPKTWLYAILKNKIADFFRQKYKQSSSMQTADPLKICFDNNGWWLPEHRPKEWKAEEEELLDNPQFNLALKNCIENLPEKWSSVIQLKFLQEQNSREICESLGITLSNFWQMIHRTKMMLRICLEANWFKPHSRN
jgi:RNA polymerase sigma-70 factor (ECF subfamily)